MGQRLVIDLIQGDKVVAAIYYHWSAYFISTIMELAKLSKAILEAEKEGKDKLLAVITKLEENEKYYDFSSKEYSLRSGGIIAEDLDKAKELYPDWQFKTKYIDRNCGLIALSDTQIGHLHDWEEGHANIHLDTHEIENSVDLDAAPFEFVDAIYETDEYDYSYPVQFESGRIKYKDRICNIDSFDCTCETIQELADFIEKALKE